MDLSTIIGIIVGVLLLGIGMASGGSLSTFGTYPRSPSLGGLSLR